MSTATETPEDTAPSKSLLRRVLDWLCALFKKKQGEKVPNFKANWLHRGEGLDLFHVCIVSDTWEHRLKRACEVRDYGVMEEFKKVLIAIERDDDLAEALRIIEILCDLNKDFKEVESESDSFIGLKNKHDGLCKQLFMVIVEINEHKSNAILYSIFNIENARLGNKFIISKNKIIDEKEEVSVIATSERNTQRPISIRIDENVGRSKGDGDFRGGINPELLTTMSIRLAQAPEPPPTNSGPSNHALGQPNEIHNAPPEENPTSPSKKNEAKTPTPSGYSQNSQLSRIFSEEGYHYQRLKALADEDLLFPDDWCSFDDIEFYFSHWGFVLIWKRPGRQSDETPVERDFRILAPKAFRQALVMRSMARYIGYRDAQRNKKSIKNSERTTQATE